MTTLAVAAGDELEFRKLGPSGPRVSGLCLGTMTLSHGLMGSGVLGQDEADPPVRAALDAHLNSFDTADVSSRAESEELLGRALKRAGIARHSVVLATKLRGTMSDAAAPETGDINNPGLSSKQFMESVDGSLRRSGLDYASTPTRPSKRRRTRSAISCARARCCISEAYSRTRPAPLARAGLVWPSPGCAGSPA